MEKIPRIIDFLKANKIILLMVTLCILMYLDIINFRGILSNGRSWQYDLLGMRLININIEIWTSLISTFIAVFGTYYYTSKSNNKVSAEQEARFLVERKDFKRELDVSNQNSYRSINKNNIDSIYSSLEEYYMLLSYTLILNKFYVDESMNRGKRILESFTKQKKYLIKLRSDFYYDKKCVEIIEHEIEKIDYVLNECTREEIFTEDNYKIIFVFDNQGVDSKFERKSKLLDYFGLKEFYSIDVYARSIYSSIDFYMQEYYTLEMEGLEKEYNIKLDLKYDYQIIYFIIFLTHGPISLLSDLGYIQYSFELFSPYTFYEKNNSLYVKFKDNQLYNGEEHRNEFDTNLDSVLKFKYNFKIHVFRENNEYIVEKIEWPFNLRQYKEIQEFVLYRFNEEGISSNTSEFTSKIRYI